MFIRSIFVAALCVSRAYSLFIQQKPLFSVESQEISSQVEDEDVPDFLASLSQTRLISVSEGESSWMSEEEIAQLIRKKAKFVDVTDGTWTELEQEAILSSEKAAPVFPTTLAQSALINSSLASISTKRMESFLKTFSNKFTTRYYRSESGRKSSQFLFDTIQSIADKIPTDAPVTLSVKKFAHGWKQFSVIARLEGVADGNFTTEEKEDIVVVSAHQDSVNGWNPWGRSPGADDDGSGTTTVLEALLTIVSNKNFIPVRPIEFHFYSAEEGGLLGSQAVVSSYLKSKIPVFAVYHSDMTGYTPSDSPPVFGIGTDFTHPELTKFLTTIVHTVSSLPTVNTKCGYACSDHASWTRGGIPAVFPFEAAFENSSPFIHSVRDTTDNIDFNHMKEFVKAVVSFAIELSLY